MRRAWQFLLLPLFLVHNACIIESASVNQAEAQTEIIASIEYLRKKCNSWPGYYLPVPANATPYGVQLCSVTIVRQDCPFESYPVFCLEMYSVDIPGIGP